MDQPTNNPNVTLDQIVLRCYKILAEASKKNDPSYNTSCEILFKPKSN